MTSCPLNVSTELLTNILHSGLHSALITTPALCPTATPAGFPILTNSTTIHAVDQGALLFPFAFLANQSLDPVPSVSSIYPLSSLLLSLISLLQWPPDWVFCITLFSIPIHFHSHSQNFKVCSRHCPWVGGPTRSGPGSLFNPMTQSPLRFHSSPVHQQYLDLEQTLRVLFSLWLNVCCSLILIHTGAPLSSAYGFFTWNIPDPKKGSCTLTFCASPC